MSEVTIKGNTYKIDLENRLLVNVLDEKDTRKIETQEQYEHFKSIVEYRER